MRSVGQRTSEAAVRRQDWYFKTASQG